MGALEKIDWEKLSGELYSVIAHASAGTDFCSPDLQIAVDGCIEEVKRALKSVEKNGSSHNKQSIKLPKEAIENIVECISNQRNIPVEFKAVLVNNFWDLL